jgi:hypothetical protein
MTQLETEPDARSAMALRVAVSLGAIPMGEPAIGWLTNEFGPRWALGVGASSGFAAASFALYVLIRSGEQTQPCLQQE